MPATMFDRLTKLVHCLERAAERIKIMVLNSQRRFRRDARPVATVGPGLPTSNPDAVTV
ncbi:hypothetical protein FIBSPDRAFT_946517 [Athelia psychrophila]|uniref:Uncharacterized protein n=1 Tax=Athelia psychrophila TaxID=1759441 RepID=A0A166SMH6_9AGAM|nr:hypothetical protein FIBSPDRAFT_946517 [Fibularhizoctonia sp. CBS 109695]